MYQRQMPDAGIIGVLSKPKVKWEQFEADSNDVASPAGRRYEAELIHALPDSNKYAQHF
jgi:hypothetical protein